MKYALNLTHCKLSRGGIIDACLAVQKCMDILQAARPHSQSLDQGSGRRRRRSPSGLGPGPGPGPGPDLIARASTREAEEEEEVAQA